MSKLFCCSINQILRLPNWDLKKTPTKPHIWTCTLVFGFKWHSEGQNTDVLQLTSCNGHCLHFICCCLQRDMESSYHSPLIISALDIINIWLHKLLINTVPPNDLKNKSCMDNFFLVRLRVNRGLYRNKEDNYLLLLLIFLIMLVFHAFLLDIFS